MNSTNHKLRVANSGLRAAPAQRGFARNSCLPIPHSAFRIRTASRRGISLLEVLISMFVLLFGLMGVAAVFPVGNHYAGKGEQYDRGAALTEAGFAELKARRLLTPEAWLYSYQLGSPGRPGEPYRFIQPDKLTNGDPNPTANLFNAPFAAAADPGPGHAFVIDPLGEAEARNAGGFTGVDLFPFTLFNNAQPLGIGANEETTSNADNPWRTGASPAPRNPIAGARWPIRRITLPTTDPSQPTMGPVVAEAMFRLHDDVTTELPKADDRPGILQWRAADLNNTPQDPSDDTLLARNYAGSYSWFATVVPTSSEGIAALQPIHPRFGSELYEVSVAVCHKRETLPSASSERSIAAQMNVGNELVIYDTNADAVDGAADKLRAGNWIAVAGVHELTGQFLLKWYKILSIDEETADVTVNSGTAQGRRLMLEGTDWPIRQTPGYADNLRAIIVPGIISVTTQYLPMENQ